MKNTLLIDLDGVLRIGNSPAKYISEFLSFIKANNINACVLSNSSLYSSKTIYDFFSNHSIKIDLPILTTVDFAVKYVEERFNSIAVYASDEVKNLLIQRGVNPSQLSSEGMGEANPVADNTTEDGRAKNRRIEAELTRN